MSQIKGKNTKPEILVRKFLHSMGFRFRIHVKDLPGKPDLVLPKLKTVIFVHGCFWHGHKNCKYFVIPKTKTEWWINKILANKLNDTSHSRSLRKDEWRVINVWECELKPAKRERTLKRLLEKLSRV